MAFKPAPRTPSTNKVNTNNNSSWTPPSTDKVVNAKANVVNNSNDTPSTSTFRSPMGDYKRVPLFTNNAPFNPSSFDEWTKIDNFKNTGLNVEDKTSENFIKDYQSSKNAFNVIKNNYSGYNTNLFNYQKTNDPRYLKNASKNLQSMMSNIDDDYGFNIKNTPQYNALKKDLIAKQQQYNDVLIDGVLKEGKVNKNELFKAHSDLINGQLGPMAKDAYERQLMNLGMSIINKGRPGDVLYNDEVYKQSSNRLNNDVTGNKGLTSYEAYKATKTGLTVISKLYNEQAQNVIKEIQSYNNEIAKFPKEFKSRAEFDVAKNIEAKRDEKVKQLNKIQENAKVTTSKVLTSHPEWKEQYENDLKNSTGDLSNKEKAIKTASNIANSILTDKGLWVLNKVGAMPISQAASESEKSKSDNWVIGTDNKGNPVMSNQMTYKDQKGDRQFNYRGIFETGTAIVGDMAYTIAVTKGLASGLSQISKAIKGIETVSANSILSNATMSRVLTFPSVYATTFPKTYFSNLGQYKTLDAASKASHLQTVIESLTETIVPDVQFFNKSSVAGTKLAKQELKAGISEVLNGLKDFNLSSKMAIMSRTGKIALKNFIQEGIIEEQAAFFANKLLDPVYQELNPELKNEETLEQSLWDSALGMAISTIVGIPSNYKQAKAQTHINFKDPSTLIDFQWQIATNSNSLKNDLKLDESLKNEDKLKAYQLIDEYKKQFEESFDFVKMPSGQTLGKDINKAYTHFGLNILRKDAVKKILEKRTEVDQAAALDLDALNTEDTIINRQYGTEELEAKLKEYNTQIEKISKSEKDYEEMSSEEKTDHWFKLYENSFKNEENIYNASIRLARHIKDVKDNKENLSDDIHTRYKESLNKAFETLKVKSKSFFKDIETLEENLPSFAYQKILAQIPTISQFEGKETRQDTLVKASIKVNALLEKALEREKTMTPEEIITTAINPPEIVATPVVENVVVTTPVQTEEESAEQLKQKAEQDEVNRKAKIDKFNTFINSKDKKGLKEQLLLEEGAVNDPEYAEKVFNGEITDNQEIIAKMGNAFLYGVIMYNQMQESTVETPATVEDKKADIEKRRQEELIKFGRSEKETSKNNIKVLGVDEYVSRDLMELAYSNDKGNNPEIGGGGQTLDRIIERGGYSKTELLQLLKPEIDKINAKYDVELVALEQKETPTVITPEAQVTSIVNENIEDVETDEEIVLGTSFIASAETGFTTSGEFLGTKNVATDTENRQLEFMTNVIDRLLSDPNKAINEGVIASNTYWFNKVLGEEKLNTFAEKIIEYRQLPETERVTKEKELLELINNLVPENTITWYLNNFKGTTVEDVKKELTKGIILIVTDKNGEPIFTNEKGDGVSTDKKYPFFRRLPIVRKKSDGTFDYDVIASRDIDTPLAQAILKTLYEAQERASKNQSFRIPIDITEISNGFTKPLPDSKIPFKGQLSKARIVDRKVMVEENGKLVTLMMPKLAEQDVKEIAELIMNFNTKYHHYIDAEEMASYLNKIVYLRKGNIYIRVEGEQLNVYSSEGNEITQEGLEKYLKTKNYNLLVPAANDDFSKIKIRPSGILDFVPYSSYSEYVNENAYYYDMIKNGNRKVYFSFSQRDLQNNPLQQNAQPRLSRKNNNNKTTLFAPKQSNVLESKIEERILAIEWFAKTFHTENIDLSYSVYEHPEAFAQFVDDSITLFKGSDSTDLYHEAWHNFTQHYLKENELNALYSTVAEYRGQVVDETNLVKYEEELADAFKKFMIDSSVIKIGKVTIQVDKPKKQYKGIIGVFQRIKDFLTSSFKDVQEDDLITKYFKEAKNIKGNRSYTKEATLFKGKTLNSAKVFLDKQGNEISLGKRLTNEILQNFDYLVVDSFKKAYPDTPFSVISLQDKKKRNMILNELYDDVYNYIYDLVYDAEGREILPDGNLKDNYLMILDNFDEFTNMHLNKNNIYTQTFKINFEETEEFSEDDKLEIVENYQKLSSLEMADENISNLIKLIPAVDKKGNLILSELTNFPKLGNFYDNWTILQKNLSGLSYEQMLKKIEKITLDYPQFKYLSENLPKTIATDQVSNLIFKNQFQKIFSMPFVDIYNGVLLDKEEFSFAFLQAGVSSLKKVKRQWSLNAIENPIFREESEGLNKINLTSLLEQYPVMPNNANEALEFLKVLGVQFGDETQVKKLIGNITTNPEFKESIEFIYNKLVNLKKVSNLSQNIIEDIGKSHKDIVNGKTIIHKSEAKALDYFASLEVKSNEEIASDMVIAANNTTIWKYGQYNYITKFINDFQNKTAQELFEMYPNLDPYKNPSIVQSIWFNQMFIKTKENGYEKGNKGIEYIKLGGLNSQLIDKGDATIDLTADDKFVYDFLSYLKTSTEEIVRFGDKSIAAAITFDTRITDTAPGDHAKLTDMIIQEIVGETIEINHLKQLYKESKENNTFMHKKFKENHDKFAIFDWLSPEIKSELLNTVFAEKNGFFYLDRFTEGSQKELYNKIKQQVEEEVEKHGAKLQGRLDKIIANIDGLSVNDILQDNNKSIQDISKWYFASSFLNRIESFHILFGSVRNFKDGGDVFKRLSMYSATGDFAMPDDITLGFMNNSKNLGRDIEFIYSKNKRDWSDKFTAIHFEEEPTNSPLANKEYFDSIEQYIPEEKKEELKHILQSYKKGEYADASGAVTLDFYKFLSYSIGTWDNPQQEAYNLQLEFLRVKENYLNNEATQEEYEEAKNKANQSSTNLVSILNPKKWQYAGSIYSQDSIAAKMDLRAFEKFAIQPLIPSMIDGTDLEVIAKSMYTNGVDMYNFVSGSKLTWDKEPYSFRKSSQNTDGTIFSPTVLSLNNFKEQLPIKNKDKDEGIFSSQMRKLLSLGLFNEGSEVEGNKQAIADYKNYKRAIADYTNILKKDIESKIRTTDDLVAFIKDEFTRRDMPEYIQDFLKVIDGNLQYALDESLHIFYTQNIISSIVNNRLVRQKLPGGQFIQVPNLGYKNASEKDNSKYGRDGLNFYYIDPKTGEVHPMEVKIAFGKKWEPLLRLPHKDGAPIRTLERLNESIKDEDFIKKYKDSFTLVGCRIPVQGLNTIEAMRVKEFLPPVAGQIVIVPAEITVKTGSDFDIDKLNIYEPQLTKYGNLLPEYEDSPLAYDTFTKEIDVQKQVLNNLREIINEAYRSLTQEELDKVPEVKALRKELYDLQNKDYQENEEDLSLEELQDYINLGIEPERVKRKDIKVDSILSLLRENSNVTEVLELVSDIKKDINEAKAKINASTIKRNNVKKGINNTLINSISKLLLNTNNYVSLMTPNEPEILINIYNTGILKANGERKAIDQNSIRKSDVFYPETSLEAFEKYTVAKSSLGIDAKMNTFFALAMEAGLKLTTASPSIFGEETSLSSQFTKPAISKFGKNDGSLSISRIIGDFMSGHVDVAKDSRISEIYADKMLTPLYLYGIMRRVHPHDMVDFLTDPSLQVLIKKIKSSQSIMARHLLNFKVGKVEASKMLNKNNIIESHLSNILKDENQEYTADLLVTKNKNIDVEATATNIINSDKASKKLKYFAEFVIMDRDSKTLRELDRSLSHDTSNYKSFIEYEYPDYIFEKLLKSNFFTAESITKMKNDSSISSLRVNDFVKDKFSQYYKIISSHVFIKKALDLYSTTYNVPIDKFAREFTNDFLTYLLQNFAEKNDISLYKQLVVDMRLLDRNNEYNIEQMVKNLLKELGPNAKYITDNAFYQSLYFNKSTDPKELKIFPSLKNPAIDSFTKEIINEDLEKLLNPAFPIAENNKIKATFSLLTTLIFLQNGTNQPLGSMISIVPTDTYTQLFKAMMENQTIQNDFNIPISEFWNKFIVMFKENRPYYSQVKKNEQGYTVPIERFDKHNYYYNRIQGNFVEISKVDTLLMSMGAKRTLKGMLQVDGQHYYLDNTMWSALNKGDGYELFLYPESGEEIYAGYTESTNSTNFISDLQTNPLSLQEVKEQPVLTTPSVNVYSNTEIVNNKSFTKVKDTTLLKLAKIKAINEYLNKHKIEYLDFPKDMSEEDIDKELNKGSESKYNKVAKSLNELEEYVKTHDDSFYDEHGEIGIQHIIEYAIEEATTLENKHIEIEGFYTFEEFIDFINSSEMEEEFRDSANEILKKYGLDKIFKEYNPDQLSLFPDTNVNLLMSNQFNTWYLTELENNPSLSEKEALEIYKNCH